MSYSSEKLKLNNSKMFNVFKYLVLIFAFLFVFSLDFTEIKALDYVFATFDDGSKKEKNSGPVNLYIEGVDEGYVSGSKVFLKTTKTEVTMKYSRTANGCGEYGIPYIKDTDGSWSRIGTSGLGITPNGSRQFEFTISYESCGFLCLYSISAGSDVKKFSFIIDNDAPAFTWERTSGKDNEWSSADNSLTYNATDSKSGIKKVEYIEPQSMRDYSPLSGNSGTLTRNIEGCYNYQFRITDNLGNYVQDSVSLCKDSVAPSITIESSTTHSTYSQQHKVTFSLYDTSPTSGIAVKKYCWSTSSEKQISDIRGSSSSSSFGVCGNFVTNTFIYTPDDLTGQYYLYLYAKDGAGNESMERSESQISLDNTAPTIRLNSANSDIGTTWRNLSEVKFDVIDNHSGVGTISHTYSLLEDLPSQLSLFALNGNGICQETVDGSSSICTGGTTGSSSSTTTTIVKSKVYIIEIAEGVANGLEVTITAKDAAGNSAPATFTLKIDNVAPELSFELDNTKAQNNHSFNIVVSDNNKGGASNNKYYLKKSDGTTTNEFNFSANDVDYKEKKYSVDTSKVSALNGKLNGSYQVCAYVKDLAGNITDSCYDTPMLFDNTKIELVEDEINVEIKDSTGNYTHSGVDENGIKAFKAGYQAIITVPLKDYSMYYGSVPTSGLTIYVNAVDKNNNPISDTVLGVKTVMELNSCTHKEQYNVNNVCNLVITVTYAQPNQAYEDAKITLTIYPTSVKDEAGNGINIAGSKELCTLVLDNTPSNVVIKRTNSIGEDIVNNKKYIYLTNETVFVKVTFEEKQIWELSASSGAYPILKIGGYEYQVSRLSDDGMSIIYYRTILASDVISAETKAELSYSGVSGNKLVDKGGNVADYENVDYDDIKEIRINSGLPEIEEMKWNIYRDFDLLKNNYYNQFGNYDEEENVYYNSKGYYVEIEVKYSVYKGLAATQYLKLENLILGDVKANDKGCSMSSHDLSTEIIKIRCGNAVDLPEGETKVEILGDFITDQSGLGNKATKSITVETNNTQEELFNSNPNPNPNELKAELYNKFIALDGVVKVAKAGEHLNGIYDAYGGKIDSYCSLFGERDCEEEPLSVTVSKENSETIDIVVYNKYGVQYIVNKSKSEDAGIEDFEIIKVNDVRIEVTGINESIKNNGVNKYVYYYETGNEAKVTIEARNDVYEDGTETKELDVEQDNIEQTLVFRSGEEIKVTVDFVEYDTSKVTLKASDLAGWTPSYDENDKLSGITCIDDGFTTGEIKELWLEIEDQNDSSYEYTYSKKLEYIEKNTSYSFYGIKLSYIPGEGNGNKVKLEIKDSNLFYRDRVEVEVDYEKLIKTITGTAIGSNTIKITILNSKEVPVQQDGTLRSCDVKEEVVECTVKVNQQSNEARFNIMQNGEKVKEETVGTIYKSGQYYAEIERNGYTYKFIYTGGSSSAPSDVKIEGIFKDENCTEKVTGVMLDTDYYLKITFKDDFVGANFNIYGVNVFKNLPDEVKEDKSIHKEDYSYNGNDKLYEYTIILKVRLKKEQN